MALTYTLERRTTTMLISLILTVVADSAGVGNGSESRAQRQGRTPRELIVVTPKKMNAVAGSTIFLPCSYTCTISGVTHTLAEWFRITDEREEERIYKFPNGDISSWPLQTSWMGDVSKCDASITVSNIKTQNSGQYRCEVTVFPQNMEDIGVLQLNVNSPSELLVVTPEKMNTLSGTKFILPCSYTCTISGVTHTLVEWFRTIDGREERVYKHPYGESDPWPIQVTWVGNVSKCDASITVSNLQTNDSGRYRCEVTVFPQNMQDIGYLQLNVQPRTDLAVVTPVEVEARVGSTVLLPCSYTCTNSDVSRTLVEWFRTIGGHNEKIYKIKYRKRSLRPLQVTWVGDKSTCNTSITISDIQTHDTGQYRCEVTVYRHNKPSIQDIGYLQLNVHNEPEPTDAAPTASPASTPAPSSVPGIVVGVIAALLVAVAGVGFYCWKKRKNYSRDPDAPPHEQKPMNPVGYDAGGSSELKNATPMPSPASTLAPSTEAGIVVGVIAALGAVTGVVLLCWKKRPCLPRKPAAPFEEIHKLNPVG